MNEAQQFASDRYAGICPEAWAAMAEAKQGHAPANGDDAWTAKASDAFHTMFEAGCEVFFALNGTAANSLALAALCQSYHSVICSDAATWKRMSAPQEGPLSSYRTFAEMLQASDQLWKFARRLQAPSPFRRSPALFVRLQPWPDCPGVCPSYPSAADSQPRRE